jgi:mono/diheme cytochrome c family protein
MQMQDNSSAKTKAYTWIKRILGTLIILLLLLSGSIYLGSEYILRKTYPVPLAAVPTFSDTISIGQGKHLTQIYHCGSCHGDRLEGKLFLDLPGVAKIYASNLTQVMGHNTDAELARVMRYAVKKDGSAAWMFASPMYYQLSDADVGKMIAYLRTLKPVENTVPAHEFKFMARLGLLIGQFKPVPEQINHQAPRTLALYDTSAVAYGKYLTTTICSGCHGPALQGDPAMGSPALSVAAAFPKAKLANLFKNGESLTGKDLPTMGKMSRKYLSHLTDKEVDAIYIYLQTLPGEQAKSITSQPVSTGSK